MTLYFQWRETQNYIERIHLEAVRLGRQYVAMCGECNKNTQSW